MITINVRNDLLIIYILNDKSIKYRRFKINMNKFLKYLLFPLLILFFSCKQNQENDSSEKNTNSSEKLNIEYTIPISFSEEFKENNDISDWTNYNLVDYNIIVLANSLEEFLNDDNYDIENQLNTIEKYLKNLRTSGFPEMFNTPEVISRFKLLNVQIANTTILLDEFNKPTLLKEFDKIFLYFNNCNNIMKYIVENKSMVID